MTKAGEGPGLIVPLAALMGLLSLSLDVYLPVLPEVALDLELTTPTDSRAMLTVFLFGFGLGHLILAIVADSLPRRGVLLSALALYVAASLFCATAPTFPLLLAGRLVQGIAAAGPRVMAMAVARDTRSGPDLARLLSLVMMVFMAVPVVAPLIGQILAAVGGWRGVTLFLALAGVAMMAVCYMRLPETWPPERRRPVSSAALGDNLRRFFGTRATVGNTAVSGLVYGAMFGIIGVSPQIYAELYGVTTWFPLLFALTGASIAAASFINVRLIRRFGTAAVLLRASLILTLLAICFTWVSAAATPSLALFQAFLLLLMFTKGLVFANCNALALQPQGAIAGFASAILGAVTMITSAAAAQLIGGLYNGQLVTLLVAYSAACAASCLCVWVGNRKRVRINV